MSGRFRSALAGPLSLCLISACGPGNATSLPGPSATAQPTDAPAATPHSSSPITNSHVFLIVLENRDYPEAISGSYTTKLAAHYGVATNYHGVAHPSLPNYLAITSGSTWGITDDGFHALPAGGLGSQLTAAGITWRAYMEGMAGDCLRSGYPYALKHNPFPYFGSTCPRQVVPFSHFDVDMAGDVPRFVWITPDLCHDGHDCSTAVADRWLQQTVPKILATSAWQEDGLLLVTWDEGYGSGNHVLTLAIHPRPMFHTSNRRYDHYSLLATIEDRLGLLRLGQAARATAMDDLLVSWPRLRG